MPDIVDLHTHSTASDGTMAPSELIAHAAERGLSAIALTDHDTVAGLDEAAAAGREHGVEVIRGIELSVVHTKGELHILGLWLPEDASAITDTLDELVRYRHNRNHIIIEKLNEAGVAITYDEVCAVAGEGSVGRPHIAQVLMEKGAASSVQDAFNRYLGPQGCAYAPKKILTPEAAIRLLSGVGATVILAHPGIYGLRGIPLREQVETFRPFGLDGIECHYSEHSAGLTGEYLSICREMDLAVSGGSDFHGTVKPNIRLGTGKGNLAIPYSVVDALKERRRMKGQPVY